MQAERGALFAVIERGQRLDLVAAEIRAAIITEVALMRFLAISWRMASLTPGAMP